MRRGSGVMAPSASSSTADPPFPSPPSGSRKTLAPRPEPPANARPGSDQWQRVRCLCGSARQDGGSEGVPNSCAQRSKSGTVIHREPLLAGREAPAERLGVAYGRAHVRGPLNGSSK